MIGLQSRANGELGSVVGSATEAGTISFGTGLLAALVVAAVQPRVRSGLRRIGSAVRDQRLPKWQLFAGFLGGWFTVVQSYATPLVGVAVFSIGMIAGQTAMSLVVDRLRIRSSAQHRISPRRIATAVITVLAVLVSGADRIELGTGELLPLAAAVVIGAVVAFHRALNAHINDYAEESLATSFLNFATGFAMLLVIDAVGVLSGAVTLRIPDGPWWMYTGGIIGFAYIAMAAVGVQRIGVLMFTALSVAGQLLGSLLLDLFVPSSGITVGPNIYAGVALSMLGILVGVAGRRTRGTVSSEEE